VGSSPTRCRGAAARCERRSGAFATPNLPRRVCPRAFASRERTSGLEPGRRTRLSAPLRAVHAFAANPRSREDFTPASATTARAGTAVTAAMVRVCGSEEGLRRTLRTRSIRGARASVGRVAVECAAPGSTARDPTERGFIIRVSPRRVKSSNKPTRCRADWAPVIRNKWLRGHQRGRRARPRIHPERAIRDRVDWTSRLDDRGVIRAHSNRNPNRNRFLGSIGRLIGTTAPGTREPERAGGERELLNGIGNVM
jgi:hypothetical protein